MMITGLRLWFSNIMNFLKGRLTLGFSKSGKKLNYDFHNRLGIYFSPVFTLVSITGVIIAFNQIILFLFLLSFESLVFVAEILNQRSVYAENSKPIGTNQAANLAENIFSEGEVRGVSLPSDKYGVYYVHLLLPDISREKIVLYCLSMSIKERLLIHLRVKNSSYSRFAQIGLLLFIMVHLGVAYENSGFNGKNNYRNSS